MQLLQVGLIVIMQTCLTTRVASCMSVIVYLFCYRSLSLSNAQMHVFDRTHRGLQFESSERKVIDANVHDVDRYEIFDPRNPLTVRRREESKHAMQQKLFSN